MNFKILTQTPVVIDLSRPAMEYTIKALAAADRAVWGDSVECELDNLRNLLQNLLERSEPEPENLDLIGG